MKTYKQWLDYQELELNSSDRPKLRNNFQIISSAFKRIGSYLLSALIQEDRLQIWQTKDRFGNTWWNVYDPSTRQSLQLASEEEVRIWLDDGQYWPRTYTTLDWMPNRYPHL